MAAMYDGSLKAPVASLYTIIFYFVGFIVFLVPTGLGVIGQCPAACRCPSSQVANCAAVALNEIPRAR